MAESSVNSGAVSGGKFGGRERTARVTGIRRGAYVEFDFTVGDEQLTVELIMPYPAFREFCIDNAVRLLPMDDGIKAELEQMKWRFGDRAGLGGER